MSDIINEAKALLTGQCCEGCSSFFDCEYEIKKYGYFCNNDDALKGGYLQAVGRLRNGTSPHNVCKYFNDRNKQAAWVYSAFPVPNEEDR